jgi:hypothetical protein
MARRDDGILPFFSTETWVKVVLVVIGLIAGMYVQHQFIEPLITDTFQEQIDACLSEKQLLNNENNQCYLNLGKCRDVCPTAPIG